MTHKARHIIYGFSGFLAALVLVLGPDLWPLLIGHGTDVWTPINSQLYRYGDGYYYAAWVHEVLENGVPPSSPSAAEFSNTPLLETLRWFPLWVAALPGYIISDFRFVYIVDYVMTVLGFFGIPYLLTVRFTRSPAAAVAVGFAVLFCVVPCWMNIPSAVGMPRTPAVLPWFTALPGMILRGPFDLFRMFEYEALHPLRYINLSISGPILMGYVVLCHLVYARAKPSVIVALPLALMTPLMAFSYPSHALIGYAALGGYSVLAFWRGHRRGGAVLVGIGVISAAILFFGGYIQYVMDVFKQNALWNNIFQKESMTLRDLPFWYYPFLLFINKYTITGTAALWLVWKHRELRDMILLLFVIACGLSVTTIFEMPQLWARFQARGIDGLWFMAILIAAVYGAMDRITSPLLVKFRYAVLTYIVMVPAIAFSIHAYETTTHNTRFMPQGRWDFLNWVKSNTPKDETIAALNWDDITFIPIYTDANLMIDNMIIGGRGPEESVTRYMALWKFLGLPRDLLQQRLTDMIELESKRLGKMTKRNGALAGPLVPEDEYASALIAEALIYWPYVDTVFGMHVDEKGRTNPALVMHLMRIYDDIDAKTVPATYPFAYVALSGEERAIPINSALPMDKVFINATHTVFKVTP
jgi:hypothetical protein